VLDLAGVAMSASIADVLAGEGPQTKLLDVPPAEKPKNPPGESDEFYTPWERFNPWHEEFRFTVDVCATAESAKVPRYYDIAADGLKQSWAGERVWCNPPYSDIAPWVRKAHNEMTAHWADHPSAELVAMLLPANRAEQQWWQTFIEPIRDGRIERIGDAAITLETRFLPGRFRFGFPGDPTGESGQSPRFGCVLVVWRSLLSEGGVR
jgi:phage N-6-adenine-methyltransferase